MKKSIQTIFFFVLFVGLFFVVGWLCVNGPVSPYAPTRTPQPTRTNEPIIRPTRPTFIQACSSTLNQSGDYVRCRMSVAYCEYQPGSAGKPTFCNDKPFPNHGFTLVLWGGDWSWMNGDCLIVDGVISIYDKKPQIVYQSNEKPEVYECK